MIARGSALVLTVLALLVLGACVRYPEPNPPQATGPAVMAPAPTPAPAPKAPTARAELPRGGIHRVKRGETVHGLAENYGVPVRTLIDVNRLSPPYALRPGQPLFIPRPREHEVVKGDTVYGISRRYGVDMSQLMRLNGITPPYTIRVGERLRIPAPVETAVASAGPTPLPTPLPTPNGQTPAGPPGQTLPPSSGTPGAGAPSAVEIEPLEPASGGSQPSTPSATAPAPMPSQPAVTQPPKAVAGLPAIKPRPAAPVAIPQPAPRLGKTFLWPVTGKVVSRFGPKQGGLHNDGINISAPQGTPIRAAENGVVAYAGNELRGFGNLLLIKHADGWTSAYAHLDQILAKRGDRVARGQVIAKVGSTGNVSAPQLHFELRVGARAVDPLQHLGSQKAAL